MPTTYTISATNSPGRTSGDVAWNDSDVDQTFFSKSNTVYQFRPGTYPLREYLHPGTGSTFKALTPIAIPANQAQFVTPDPTRLVVFETANPNATERVKNSQVAGGIALDSKSSVTLQDLFMLGFTGIELNATTNSKVERCIVQNYLGTYPNGKWCWHQRTGSFWQTIGCNGNTFKSCIAQYANHHGFLNHDSRAKSGYGYVKNTTWDDCRSLMAGCAKEPDGTGYQDWGCAFDLGEDIDIDGILVKNCYAENGWKSNFYYETEATAKEGRGFGYVRKNVVLEDCIAVGGGRAGGGIRGTMSIKEGESANYVIHSGTLRRCKSYNGSKAGFHARQDRDLVPGPIVYEDCLDCGSNIGYLAEFGGIDATYRNCISANAAKWAWKVMGDEIALENCRIKVKSGQTNPPIYIGGYGRVFNQDSPDATVRAKADAEWKRTDWPVKNLTISACIDGLPSGVAAYKVHPGTSQSLSGVAIRTGCTNAIPSTVCDRTTTTTPEDPVDPVIPDPIPSTPGKIYFRNARITPSSGSYGTRFVLIIEPHEGP
jgi:hypothetical protein